MNDQHSAVSRPAVAESVTVFRSIGGIVDAAASTASVFLDDLDRYSKVLPPALYGELRGLCDAVYDLDYRVANGD